jgi:hypothetical protein
MFSLESSPLNCVSHCRLDKPLTLQNDRHVTCAMITMGLSPVADYQQALMPPLTQSLARLDNNPRLQEGARQRRSSEFCHADHGLRRGDIREIYRTVGAGPAVDDQVDR